jgi:thiamine biosynthesis lipoprotein ApbE
MISTRRSWKSPKTEEQNSGVRNQKSEVGNRRSRFRLLASGFCLLSFLIVASTATPQEAAPQQFQQNFSIRGRINGTIIVLGWPADAANIQKLADMVIAEAQKTYDALDASNPSSEVARINAAAGTGKQKASWQVVDAYKAAKKVAEWSRGAFDVVVVGGDYKSIGIDDKENTVELKKSGMETRFDPIMEGILADYMITLINQANMRNAMVRAGNVFRGSGMSTHGPWAIQVQEDSASYARHALNITVSDKGVATISATDFRSKPLIDYRSKTAVAPPEKGATIMMGEAALAQGVAYAVFVVGPKDGMDLLAKAGARGLIVDLQGKFLRTAGF